MWKRKLLARLMEAAAGGDGAGGGGGGAEGSMLSEAAAGGAATGGQGGDASAGGGGQTTEKPAGQTSSDQADPFAWLPEKYRVKGAEGKLDMVASAMKVNEARDALEKRMGAGAGLPPEKAEDYKSDGVIAAIKEKNGGKDVQLPAPMLADFAKFAHDAGLTQAQYDKALGAYLGGIQQMIDTSFDNAMATGKQQLSTVWGAPDTPMFKENMGAAVRAFNTYMPANLRTAANMDAIGNHPIVLQMMAAVGKELKEDTPPPGAGASGGESIAKLQSSPAYWNAKHPDHAATVAQVNAYYAKGGKRPGA